MSGAALSARLLTRLRSYDRPPLIAAAVLVAAGFVLSLAASPGQVAREGIGAAFHFSWRQGLFALIGLCVFLVAASLSPRGARRAAAIVYVVTLVLMGVVLAAAPVIKGARRWVEIGGLTVQPSEFLKPALVILAAWMLAEQQKSPRFPGLAIVLGLFATPAFLLWRQPDVGQAALLAMTLWVMLYTAGISWRWLVGGVGAALAAGFAAYEFLPHARARLVSFFGPDNSPQVSLALDAIGAGGVLGRGPGEGVVKNAVPDAHSDFIYAVAAEEFGLLASLGLILLYAVIAWRGLSRARRLVDPFEQLAACGLFAVVGLQACVHIAVNLDLAPPKGMTLPLVSYGGSSMVSAAATLGLAFALTRRRPGAFLYERGG